MNLEGYVPLWRKALNNKVRRNDPTAWRVFETLLLASDYTTGVWEGGRYQLVDLVGSIRGVTLYKALKRLEKAKMVTLESNTRYTRITICKMAAYSLNGNTKREQHSNTSGNTSGNTLTIKKINKRKESELAIEKPLATNKSIKSKLRKDNPKVYERLYG